MSLFYITHVRSVRNGHYAFGLCQKILRDIQTFFKGINILKGIVHSFLFDCIYAFDCFTCNYWLNHF